MVTLMFQDHFTPSYGFDEVAIRQKKCVVKSRLEVDISSEVIRGVVLNVPLMSANMSTVTDAEFAIALGKLGALGVLHRVGSREERIEEARTVSKVLGYCASSVGVGEAEKSIVRSLSNAGCTIFFIDIAHGYCDEVIEMCKFIKTEIPKAKVVAGNTTNLQMLCDVNDYADAVKVGIGSGASCLTKNTAGCFERQFSAVYNMARVADELGMPIISDGGIREPADFVKAIGAGANSVMAGSIFAQCPESAARELVISGKVMKIYSGMASKAVQDEWKGGMKRGTCEEGVSMFLDIGEPVERLVERYSGALRSGISYAGGYNVRSFQSTVEFVEI